MQPKPYIFNYLVEVFLSSECKLTVSYSSSFPLITE